MDTSKETSTPTPILYNKDGFLDYKIAMRDKFMEKFPKLAGVINAVLPGPAVAALAAGHAANIANPGARPVAPAPVGDIAAQNLQLNIHKDAVEAWKHEYDIYTKHVDSQIALCGFICGTLKGDAISKLRDHADYQAAVNDHDYRRLWQLVLGLYIPVGARRTQLINEKMANINSFSAIPRETTAQYLTRFKKLTDECTDLGIVLDQEQICTALVMGLPDEYQNFKENFHQSEELQDLEVQELKVRIENHPIAKKKPYQNFNVKPNNQPGAVNAVANNKVVRLSNEEWNNLSPEAKAKKIAEDKAKKASRECYSCGQKGHLARNCTKNASC